MHHVIHGCVCARLTCSLCALRCNPKLPQVHRGVCYDDTRSGGSRRLAITTVDAPLVSVGDTHHMMDFDNSQPYVAGGMHFNLHNNVGWDCSSPWWTDDDAQFGFRIDLSPPEQGCGWE
jgi:hypothetical protein